MHTACWVVTVAILGSLSVRAEAPSSAAPGKLSSATTVEPDRLPAGTDLRGVFRRAGLTERRQGNRGTCSAFTVVGALEFAVTKRHGQSPRLSVEFLNWAANQTGGDTNDGAFFSDLWNGFAAHGICTEKTMPYAAKFDPAAQPSTDALADAKSRMPLGLQFHWIKEWNVNTGLTDVHLASIRRTLAEGWPVCGGFRWPSQPKWVKGVLQMCAPNAVYDGHSVLLVGYCDDANHPGGGVFMFRNTAGEGRDGSLPYAYAQAFMNDAAWVDDGGQNPHLTAARSRAGGD